MTDLELQNIVNGMPRYPLLDAALKRAGVSDEEAAKVAHMSPVRLRACIMGTAKRGIMSDEAIRLAVFLKRDYEDLFFTINKVLGNEKICNAIEQVALLSSEKWAVEAALHHALGELTPYDKLCAIRLLLAVTYTITHCKPHQVSA